MSAGRNWPESQRAWQLLAEDWDMMQREAKAIQWEKLRAEEAADAALYEPLSPEEEETLF